jgi:general secretion pathway protein G
VDGAAEIEELMREEEPRRTETLAYASRCRVFDAEVRPLQPPIAWLFSWQVAVCGVAVLACAVAIKPDLLFGTSCGDHFRQRTRSHVSWGGVWTTQLEVYQLDNGRYPHSLAELTTRPADPVAAQKPGSGPYISPGLLIDAWGHPFQYRLPGVHNPTKFDLWSMGPDGINGTTDDIGNWE